ncbi:MAG: hypothetical protein JOZ29_06630 [Deltaproteobacteria bacterium]|nr:hypothetical protein [Deltaproteobacteria bacterium]
MFAISILGGSWEGINEWREKRGQRRLSLRALVKFGVLAIACLLFVFGISYLAAGRDWTVMTALFRSTEAPPFWQEAPRPTTIEQYFKEYAGGRFGAGSIDLILPTQAENLPVIMTTYVETESNSRFAGFLLNDHDNTATAAMWLAQNWGRLLPTINGFSASVTTPGEIPGKEKRTNFSGQIYLYTDGSLTVDAMHEIQDAFRANSVTATFRNFKFLIDSYKPKQIHRLL